MKRTLPLVFALACGHASGAGDAHPMASAGGSASVAPIASMLAIVKAPVVPGLAHVAITVESPGRFEISNRGATNVSLLTISTIERQDAAGWAPLPYLDLGKGYHLIESCGRHYPPDDPPVCTDIAPGATLVPVAWSGFNCSAQCNGTCRANSFEGPGAFRLVVSTCDGGEHLESPAFDLPASANAEMERWGLTTDVTSATAVRLDLPSEMGFDAAAPPSPLRVAGFSIHPSTDAPMDRPMLDELLALMRDAHNFDDQIAKRCAVHDLVGVKLVRSPRTTAASPTPHVAEIALDFACQKFFAAFGDAKHRVTIASHFDPSRAAFTAWAKRVFPNDPQIAKLH